MIYIIRTPLVVVFVNFCEFAKNFSLKAARSTKFDNKELNFTYISLSLLAYLYILT